MEAPTIRKTEDGLLWTVNRGDNFRWMDDRYTRVLGNQGLWYPEKAPETDDPAIIYEWLYSMGRYKDGPWQSYISLFDKYIGSRAAVLDAGCGLGLASDWLRKKGHRVTSVDVANSYEHTQVANLTDLPFQDGEFDATFCCDVLEHLEPRDIDAATDEIKRVTRKYAMISVGLGDSIFIYNNENLHKTQLTKDQWQAHLEARFKILRVDNKGHTVGFYLEVIPEVQELSEDD